MGSEDTMDKVSSEEVEPAKKSSKKKPSKQEDISPIEEKLLPEDSKPSKKLSGKKPSKVEDTSPTEDTPKDMLSEEELISEASSKIVSSKSEPLSTSKTTENVALKDEQKKKPKSKREE